MSINAIDLVRTRGAVDAHRMARAKVVMVGVGGSTGICEDLARTGLGELHAIDFDHVSATNLATQGYRARDIGKPKVQALKELLADITPDVKYVGHEEDFLKLDEEHVRSLVGDADLLMMMTDDFHAQARGNKVALRLGVPAIFAMVYERARAAEITFTIPGVTPACHRCAVGPRYRAYEKGFRNNVTANGSTVFSTHYLNSVLGHLALAILHRDDADVEFGGWFGQQCDRNLIQLRLSPKYGHDDPTIFQRLLGAVPQAVAFDAVWQRVTPDTGSTECPDCHGTGDLRKCIEGAP